MRHDTFASARAVIAASLAAALSLPTPALGDPGQAAAPTPAKQGSGNGFDYRWIPRAHERGTRLDFDVVSAGLHRPFVKNALPVWGIALTPVLTFQLDDGSRLGSGHFVEIDVPFGFTTTAIHSTDYSTSPEILFGNPSAAYRWALKTDSDWVPSVGVRVTVPTNTAEYKETDSSTALAMSVLGASRGGHELHRFAPGYFSLSLPVSLEVRLKQLHVLGEATGLMFLPTFARFDHDTTRLGIQTAAEVALRTAPDDAPRPPGLCVFGGLRFQVTFVDGKGRDAPLAVPATSDVAIGPQLRGAGTAATVEPFLGFEDLSFYARATVVVPVLKPLEIGPNDDHLLAVRLTVGQRF